jgi:MazG family protein
LFLVNLYEEQGLFSLDDALALSIRKMIHRHPHVFGSASVSSAEEVMHNWQELKVQEGKSARKSYLDGIARALPALVRADHLTARAARVGFDWDSPEKVIEKVKEEISELEQALGQGDRNAAAAEVGDMLFSMVNLARHLGIDPEQALRRTNDTFCRRFAAVESGLTEQGKTLQEATLAEMDTLWDAEKKRERATEDAS